MALGVERTFAWLNQFRRLRVRYEKRADIHEAFLSMACALICWNTLENGQSNSGPLVGLLCCGALPSIRR
jgi:Transposase DDE domain